MRSLNLNCKDSQNVHLLRCCFVSLSIIKFCCVYVKPPPPNCQASEIKDSSTSLKYYGNVVHKVSVVYIVRVTCSG